MLFKSKDNKLNSLPPRARHSAPKVVWHERFLKGTPATRQSVPHSLSTPRWSALRCLASDLFARAVGRKEERKSLKTRARVSAVMKDSVPPRTICHLRVCFPSPSREPTLIQMSSLAGSARGAGSSNEPHKRGRHPLNEACHLALAEFA